MTRKDMADKPKNNLPKVPPFIIPGASNQPADEPAPQSAYVVQAPKPRTTNKQNSSPPGIFSSLILAISVISMGVAMISGAWFAYTILTPEAGGEVASPEQATQPQDNVPPTTTENNAAEDIGGQMDILSKIIVVGLTYIVGWIFSAIGVRSLGNLILPYAIQVYTWVVLGGILVLQVLIMSRLYQQDYLIGNYIQYLVLFAAGLIALVGLHLILEKHSLMPFGFIILLASLGHLYSIAYHYIFADKVVHGKVWGDITFFFVTTVVSVLMMAHFGFLNGMRRLIDRIFSPNDNQFSSPN